MEPSWTKLPLDIKILIVKPLDRISKINLRQCSWDDKHLVDSLFTPIKAIYFVANRSYITITYDGDLSDFFEIHEEGTAVRRQKYLIPFSRFLVADNFQCVAWKSLRNMLKSQNNKVDTLHFTFIGSLNFSGEPEPERIVPELPQETVTVREICILGDSTEGINHRIVRFAKPEIEKLTVDVRVVHLSQISELGNMEQVRNVRDLSISVPMKLKQALQLNATKMTNKSTLFDDEDIIVLLKKSLEKDTPSQFNYYRMWPDHNKITSAFNATLWSPDLYCWYKNPPKVNLTHKNYVLSSVDGSDEKQIFVAFQRYSVSGFILKKL